jgi:hypothetical protein
MDSDPVENEGVIFEILAGFDVVLILICPVELYFLALVGDSCDVTRSVSKMTEIKGRGGKRWDKPKKAGKSRDCRGGKF